MSKFFLFGALPSDTLKINHTKNLKEIPSRHVLENLLEKSKHSCLYDSFSDVGEIRVYSVSSLVVPKMEEGISGTGAVKNSK